MTGKLYIFYFKISIVQQLFNIRRFLTKNMAAKYKIVMVRHGESEWNQQNLFCGWYDANLSDKGIYFICYYDL